MTASSKQDHINVLYVEDDEYDVKAFRRVLEGGIPPIHVSRCSRAEEALELVGDDGSGFDVVVADHKLPGTSGLELCKDMLARKVPVPLVILTGRGSEVVAVEALKAGVYDYLIKDGENGYLKLLPAVLPAVVRAHADRMARRRAEEELRTAHDELERRVEERTRELKLELGKREEAEEALVVSEEKYRSLFEQANDSIFISDLDTRRFIDVNQNAAKRLGYTREELLRLGFADIDTPEVAAAIKNYLKELMASGNVVFESIHRRKDGSSMPVEGSSRILELGGRKVIETFVRDITERKRAEEAMREAKEAAEYADRVKSEFMANMSHELRTPLNAIIGFCDAIRTQVFGPLGNEKYVEYMDAIHVSGQHLLDLINDLLDISVIEASKLELHDQVIDIGKAVDGALRLLGTRAEKGRVSMSAELEDGLPALRADERRIRQILLNLLSNAVKFTPEGGHVKVGAALEADGAMALSVTDTGIGMKPEEIAEARAPFGRTTSDLTRSREGTGLGLYLTGILAELHGGGMDIESEKGKGTTVTVRFPADRVV